MAVNKEHANTAHEITRR